VWRGLHRRRGQVHPSDVDRLLDTGNPLLCGDSQRAHADPVSGGFPHTFVNDHPPVPARPQKENHTITQSHAPLTHARLFLNQKRFKRLIEDYCGRESVTVASQSQSVISFSAGVLRCPDLERGLDMKTEFLAIAAVAIVLTATASATAFASMQNRHKTSALAYHDTWRKLWEDHVWWTRMVIIGVFDDLGGTGNYTARLIRNYGDMEDALKPFYGDEAEELGDLLQQHLLIAADILVKVKNGQNATSSIAAWYKNADDIVMKMNEMNPKYWKLAEAKKMWKEHLDLTMEEALAHFNKDWAKDVTAFDKVHDLALMMADFFSNGVIKQFPNMFIRNGLVARP